MVLESVFTLLICKLFCVLSFYLKQLVNFLFLYVVLLVRLVADCRTFALLLFYKGKALWKEKEMDYTTLPMSMMHVVWGWS